MRQKYTHTCERCGLEAHLERTGRFRDEDFVEVLHELMALERDMRQQLALAQLRITHLERALDTEATLAKNFQVIAERWQREYEKSLEGIAF